MKNVGRAVSFDDMLDAVADTQRRKLLLALLEHNPQDDTPVAASGDDGDVDAVERLVTMEHVHLPKLVDYGFIDWDREAHEVTKGPRFDDIEPLLELLDEHGNELPSDWS